MTSRTRAPRNGVRAGPAMGKMRITSGCLATRRTGIGSADNGVVSVVLRSRSVKASRADCACWSRTVRRRLRTKNSWSKIWSASAFASRTKPNRSTASVGWPSRWSALLMPERVACPTALDKVPFRPAAAQAKREFVFRAARMALAATSVE